jgi:hypothetical protein
METLSEVECPVCKVPFVAGTYAMAHKKMREHKEVAHDRWAQAQKVASDELALSKWDLRFLDFCGIQFL